MTDDIYNEANTTPRVFSATVARYGDRVALRHKDQGLWHDISWNRYFQNARAISLALMEMGLEKGDCVAIMGDNCPQWVLADMGIQCAGGVSVGIYATNAWHQVQYIIEHCRARFFFVENEEQLDKWLHGRETLTTLQKVIVWDTEGLRGFEDPLVMDFEALLARGQELAEQNARQFECRMASVAPDDLAVLIYTDPCQCHLDGPGRRPNQRRL